MQGKKKPFLAKTVEPNTTWYNMKLNHILLALAAVLTLGLTGCVATGSASGSTSHSGSVSGTGAVHH